MPRRNKGPHLIWRADRNRWHIRWFENGRKRALSTRTGNRIDAEKALARHIIGNETSGQRNPDQRFIADTLTDYGLDRGPHVSDPARIGETIAALVPFFGAHPVSFINEKTCRDYCTSRAVKPGTARRELTTLRAAINLDFRQGRLTAAVPVWLPPKPEGKDRWLTRKEVAALLRAAKTSLKGRLHLPLFILIGVYTGARKEAILSLRWPQVDLDRRLIDFNPPGRERTAKGRPIIPIPRRLMTFLRLARKRGHDTGFVISYPMKKNPADKGNRKKKATRSGVGNIKHSYHNAVVKAGLATEYKYTRQSITPDGNAVSLVIPVTDVTPHTLRHTSASWMVQGGVSFARVARWLGHRDSRTTESIYAHHAPDYLDDAASSFD